MALKMETPLESALEQARRRHPGSLPGDFAYRVLRQSRLETTRTPWIATLAGLKLTVATAVLIAAAVAWGTTQVSQSPPTIDAFSKPLHFLAP